MKNIRDLSYKELETWLTKNEKKKFRAKQIFLWLYNKFAKDADEMKNLPEELRQKLAQSFSFYLPEKIKKQKSSIDNTVKYLLKLSDGEVIETVVIPAKDRSTICLSSQIGCRYACKFCASGMLGYKRNLSQGEILSQILTALIDGHRITNIVFMGTGEPLDNLENVLGAIDIINNKDGFNVGARKMTISTAGIPEKIIELSKYDKQVELSLSLHAPNDELRNRIMPINRKYSLNEVTTALKTFQSKTKRLVTFEYIVIKGLNDSRKTILELAELSKKLHSKINLISYSPVGDLEYKRPDDKEMRNIEKILTEKGVLVTIRASKGADILAACGQLRIKSAN